MFFTSLNNPRISNVYVLIINHYSTKGKAYAYLTILPCGIALPYLYLYIGEY